MNREEMIKKLYARQTPWDVLIIGGGATGLGLAVDSALRGYHTLLVEQSDFAKGTSSKSTKLIHGGLRYLQQGNLYLVKEALKERGRLCRNAPHLMRQRSFFVPHYHWWESPFYNMGLKLYDLLAGKLKLQPSYHLSYEKTLSLFPNLQPKRLRGGMVYYDGQFDDTRLAITLAQTAADHNATLINYMQVQSLIKKDGRIQGVYLEDQESGKQKDVYAQVVINATGAFCDHIRHMDEKNTPPIIQPSQGIHLVLDKRFLPGETALLIPHTEDKRLIFILPWHDHLLVGTTDTPVEMIDLEPIPLEKEVDFILNQVKQYLTDFPTKQDILSVFAGLRPLIRQTGEKTSSLTREHKVMISPSQLITIAGGKWTTYRKMAEDTLDQAIRAGLLARSICKTKTLPLHGYAKGLDSDVPWNLYGSECHALNHLFKEKKSYRLPLHPKLPYLQGQVIWAVRHEMARTLEDVLARRTRCLLLNAALSVEIAQEVALLMQKELKQSDAWVQQQVNMFKKLALRYMIQKNK